MAQEMNPFVVRGIHRGMVDDSIVGDNRMSQDQVRRILNMNDDAIGYLTRRNGYEKLDDDPVVNTKPSLGLHHHVGTNSQLIAFSDNAGAANAESYYLSGGTWTNEALGFTAGTKVRATTFLDRVFAVNGTDNPKSWSGNPSDSWDTTSLVSAPVGHIIQAFRQQLYIINTDDDTVYFSSIPTSGAVTWDTTNDNFIVNPNDGSNLTAAVPFGNEFVLFKRKYFYRFNGRSVDADPIFNFGTASQESVASHKTGLYFYDPYNCSIFVYSGGYPQDIGRAIQKYICAIPTANEADVIARAIGDTIEFFVGDITVDGTTYSNAALRYRINSKSWSIRTYADDFKAHTIYDDGTDIVSLLGTDDGYVMKMDTGNDDDGSSIPFEIETQWYFMSQNADSVFRLREFVTLMDQGVGMTVQYTTDNDNGTWRELGRSSAFASEYQQINKDFKRIKFRFTGNSDATPEIFDGFVAKTSLIEP